MAYNIAPSKQDLLVSGTNIKTINSNNILGSGNLTIAGLPTSTNPTDADKVVAVDSSGVASWQYAGLGAGSLGTNNVILGRVKPSGLLVGGTDNTVSGIGSGNALTGGNQNAFYGTNAGYSITTGQRMNCFGYNAGYSQTTSVFSVYVGAYSGYGAILGSYNTAVGDTAMYNNTASVSNAISIGYATRVDASYGISIGSQAVGPGIAIGANSSSGANANIILGREGGGDYYQNNNGLCIGSDTYPINRVFLGMGGKNAANTVSQAVQIRTSNVIGGADKPATLGTLTLSGNQGTGSGLGSDVIISTSPAGTPGGTTPNAYVERLRCKAATEVVINDTGVDFDFRVEGDTDANLLFVDASTDRVGIGTDSPATKLHTQQTSAATSTVTNILRVDSQSSGTPANGIGVGIEMAAETASGNTEIGVVLEAVTTDVTSTSEDFDFVVKTMAAGATAAERMRVKSDGSVNASEFRVTNYRLDPHIHDEGTETGNFTINWANSPSQDVTINAAGPLTVTLQNPVTGGAYLIKIIQGATPGTLTWPATVKWGTAGAPTLSNTTGLIDIINLYWDGTNYYGTYALGY